MQNRRKMGFEYEFNPGFEYSFYIDTPDRDNISEHGKGWRTYYAIDGEPIETFSLAEIEHDEQEEFIHWLHETEEAAKAQGRIFKSAVDHDIQMYDVNTFGRFLYPQTAMLIDPWLPRGGNLMIYGKPESGKSILCTRLAKEIAEGGEFFGYKCEQGTVVYVEIDMSVPVTQGRIADHMDVMPKKNLYFVVGTMRRRIEQTTSDEEWVKSINSVEPDLIIFDSLRRLHGLNENDSDTPAIVLGKLRRLFGGTPTICWIHHTRKDQPDQTNYDEDYRGTIAWGADMDTIIKVQGKGANKRKISFGKTRTCGPQEDVSGWINPQTLLMEDVAAAVDEQNMKGNVSAVDAVTEIWARYPDLEKKYVVERLKEGGFGQSTAYKAIAQYERIKQGEKS